jgi:osmotically-inducible protein OsmY
MTHDEAPQPTPYLVARVRDAFAHDERVAALDINVRIVGGSAFLTGTVTTSERRDACERVAREVLPGHTIHNQLVLLDQHAPSAPEEVR